MQCRILVFALKGKAKGRPGLHYAPCVQAFTPQSPGVAKALAAHSVAERR